MPPQSAHFSTLPVPGSLSAFQLFVSGAASRLPTGINYFENCCRRRNPKEATERASTVIQRLAAYPEPAQISTRVLVVIVTATMPEAAPASSARALQRIQLDDAGKLVT
jgi:hypothetical protein